MIYRSAASSFSCAFSGSILILSALTITVHSECAQADDAAAVREQAKKEQAQKTEYFESSVRPLLHEKCSECHGPTKQESGLRFDRRTDVIGKSIHDTLLADPGSPDQSRILQVIRHSENEVQMPPNGKLTDAEIQILTDWISSGAFWPEESEQEKEAARSELERENRRRNHWAFQPATLPDLSECGDENPIDFLIVRRLNERQMQLSPPASPSILLRRLSFVITGLRPNYDDLKLSQGITGSTATATWFEAHLDRLLSSPHFGERWARYWLDVSRYADTKGYVFTENREYPDAWRYREWVIRAINGDMPYDEFLKRQLAADRMPIPQNSDELAAMGFLTLGRRFLNNRHDIIDDRIDVTIRGMMGLTASCARCHDHKYDPIPTADYYSLYGIFDSSDEPGGEPGSLRLADREKPSEPVIFVRGLPGNRGASVPRQFLTAFSAPDAQPFSNGSGRLELAEAIASRNNPLTARVAVNRIWRNLFGRGLVESGSDFGLRTDVPVQKDLLDLLAVRLMEDGWSTKKLIRLIVTSRTWQQSSDLVPNAEVIDAENQLLFRMNRRRLDFEAHRDALLSASGRLDLTVGGPSIDITVPESPLRRTVYARIDRQNLPMIFRTFDVASPDAHSPGRFETTVPQQALFQLNNEFVLNQADAAAATAVAASNNSEGRIEAIYRSTLQREPTNEEKTFSAQFLQWHSEHSTPELNALSQLAQTLMLTNEFVFID